MFNRIHVVLDACVIVIAYLLTYHIRFNILTNFYFFTIGIHEFFYPLQFYAKSLVVLVPLYIFVYYFSRLYTPKRYKSSWTEILNVIIANFFGIAFFVSYLYITKEQDISRGFLVLFFVVNIVMNVAVRLMLSRILKIARRKGYNLKHVLLVGYGHSAEAYIDRIFANPQWGYYVHGILDDKLEVGTMYKKVPIIGTITHLDSFLSKMTLDEIAITLSVNEYEKLENICRHL